MRRAGPDRRHLPSKSGSPKPQPDARAQPLHDLTILAGPISINSSGNTPHKTGEAGARFPPCRPGRSAPPAKRQTKTKTPRAQRLRCAERVRIENVSCRRNPGSTRLQPNSRAQPPHDLTILEGQISIGASGQGATKDRRGRRALRIQSPWTLSTTAKRQTKPNQTKSSQNKIHAML
jgi:hypothetical protein